MSGRQEPKFRTDPVPYEGVRLIPVAGEGSAWVAVVQPDGYSMAKKLTARQLRTLAVDAMQMAADLLVDGEGVEATL